MGIKRDKDLIGRSWQAGYCQGAGQMRERAAKLVEQAGAYKVTDGRCIKVQIAEAIRALPLDADQETGDG